MKKLLLLSLFSLCMQAMGMADPQMLQALSIKRTVAPQPKRLISMNVLKPRPTRKNYQSIHNDEPSEKKEKGSWPKLFVYLCCLPHE